ncbi:Macrolide export ATP-binding/permease protein MacB [bioreactor metagenome]|uniref:Macrolide export ATP-binding/permease protein MacB n=1 Tax=bioreactor metagenome TaxID=1076179 RepID=A0A644YUL1_9ZZZZ|nr:ABC transporter permease [Candidatus Metalachnospira sp.]
MNFTESFSLAIKNIVASKTRSILTMLGIIIGVAAVILITGLGNGMNNYMQQTFESMGTNSLTVNVMGRGSKKMSVDGMQKIVDDNSDVFEYMSPTTTASGSIKVGTDSLDSTTPTGVNEQYFKIKDLTVDKGRGLEYIDMVKRTHICVVGTYVNKEYFAGNALGDYIKINGTKYIVVGILEEKGDSTEYSDDNIIYVPYTTVSRLNNNDIIGEYTVTFKDTDNAAAAKTLLEDELTKYFNDSDAFYIMSLSELLDQMTTMTNVMITILTIIAGISLLVGGIGIMNIMLVSVTERTREIGIRKALGAKEHYIMSQFVIEAAVTSALGGVIGILFGYILCAIATPIVTSLAEESITVIPSILSVMSSFGISAGIGVFFGYMPAKKAARLNPIDALRYD